MHRARRGGPSLMRPWFYYLGQASRGPAIARLLRSRRSAREAQERVLAEVLRAASGTSFAAQHSLARVRTLEEFKRRVPIMDSEAHQAHIAAILEGDRRRLFHEDVLAWASTSGTSGRTKLYPITRSYRKQYLRTVQAFLFFLARDHPRAFDHHLLYVTGPSHEGFARDGVPIVSMSGFNNAAQPPFIQRRYAIPVSVANLSDPERSYLAARHALSRRVSLAVSILASGLTSLIHTARENAERLIRDIADGTWLPPDRAEPNPARARELERLLTSDRFEPRHIWPDLRLLCCWKGAAAGTFLPELRALCPGVPIRDAIYSATEGWLNIPWSDERIGGPVAVNSHVLELACEDGDETVFCHQAEVGKQYRTILTTSGGLYRYDLGDIVEVTGKWGDIPEIAFVRKAGHASNIAGEKLVEPHVLAAAKKAGGAAFFALLPNLHASPSRYDLYVEHDDPRSFAERFEAGLREESWEYDSIRRAQTLGPVVAIPLPSGAWDRLRALRAREGAVSAQLKPPHLTQHPAWRAALDAITVFDR